MIRGKFFSIAKRFYSHTEDFFSKNPHAVRVRIWRSGYFDKKDNFIGSNVTSSLFIAKSGIAEANIGHVSIETQNLYASLWPKTGLSVSDKLKSVESDNRKNSPKSDELAEKRVADILVDFLTLDTKLIEQEIIQFQQKGGKYNLTGRWFFQKELANNCSGHAFDLLVSGGLRKLLSINAIFISNFIMTPNRLISIVRQAKQEEINSNKLDDLSSSYKP